MWIWGIVFREKLEPQRAAAHRGGRLPCAGRLLPDTRHLPSLHLQPAQREPQDARAGLCRDRRGLLPRRPLRALLGLEPAVAPAPHTRPPRPIPAAHRGGQRGISRVRTPSPATVSEIARRLLPLGACASG